MCVSYALSFIFSQQNGPHFRHLLGFLILGIPYTPIFSGHIKFSKVLHNTKQPESSCNVQICQDFRGLISSCIYYHLHFQVISSRISHVFPHLLRAHHFRQCPTLCPAASPSMMGCQPLSCRSALKRRQVTSEAARERRNHNGTKILKRTEADHSLTTVNGDFNGDLMVI